jgi:hypothetical protein
MTLGARHGSLQRGNTNQVGLAAADAWGGCSTKARHNHVLPALPLVQTLQYAGSSMIDICIKARGPLLKYPGVLVARVES